MLFLSFALVLEEYNLFLVILPASSRMLFLSLALVLEEYNPYAHPLTRCEMRTVFPYAALLIFSVFGGAQVVTTLALCTVHDKMTHSSVTPGGAVATTNCLLLITDRLFPYYYQNLITSARVNLWNTRGRTVLVFDATRRPRLSICDRLSESIYGRSSQEANSGHFLLIYKHRLIDTGISKIPNASNPTRTEVGGTRSYIFRIPIG
ncbi:hypothetical protein J6590_044022 [Homalodisca vitripennis]|nr:hypothetical protein J6590_044022 [Homalodisca vitripennis]